MQRQSKTKFTVLAISKLYNTRISIVGVDEGRRWIRPMPMYQSDLYSKDNLVLNVFTVAEISINDWWGSSPRPEDRFFNRKEQQQPVKLWDMKESERAKFLRSLADVSVDAIFSRGRTVGLIKPTVKDANFRRNPYYPAEYEARFVFEDGIGGTVHNWMCNDLMWHQNLQEFIRKNPGMLSSKLKELKDLLNTRESYFVVGLTKLLLEYPGPYGGCWPQVLGVIIL
jgi:hypothetical protein